MSAPAAVAAIRRTSMCRTPSRRAPGLLFMVCLLGVVLVSAPHLPAQQRALKLRPDAGRYRDLAPATVLYRGPAAAPLPSRSSLKAFAPTPADQEDYNTSPAWAAAYGAFTCLIAAERGITSRASIDSIAFSAPFVYRLAVGEQVDDCQTPVSLLDVLDVLVGRGAIARHPDEGGCMERVPAVALARAAEARLSGYKKLFDADASGKDQAVKRSLAAGKPVVAGLVVGNSFLDAGERWVPDPHEYQRYTGAADTAQAVTVIGYDDERFGGAFEIMNSFGTSWGDHGTTWVTYDDFGRFCFQALELILDRQALDTFVLPISETRAVTAPEDDLVGGTIEMALLPAREIVPVAEGDRFLFEQPFASGELFRLVITVWNDAYVYAFTADDTHRTVSQIFPDPRRKTNPHILGGAAFCLPGPGPGYYSTFDSTAGTDYLCILIAERPLAPERLAERMNRVGGLLPERVKRVLEEEGIVEPTLSVSEGRSAAWSAPRMTGVVPLLFELQHTGPARGGRTGAR